MDPHLAASTAPIPRAPRALERPTPGAAPRPFPSALPSPLPSALTAGVLRVLAQHPGAALPAGVVRERAELEGTLAPEGRDALLEALRSRGDLFQLLVPRQGGPVESRSGPWVVARQPSPKESAAHPIVACVQASLRILAGAVDPGSLREMARWERYLLEEAEVQRALRRRLRREERRRARHRVRPRPRLE
jgi:hypothetical protein